MGGPVFAGSSHVTRTLSVEPGIPATLGAAGADGCSIHVIDRDRHRFGGDAVLLLLPVVHLHRHRVAGLLRVSKSRGDLVRIWPEEDRMVNESAPGPSRLYLSVLLSGVRGRDRAADVLPRPRVLIHSQRDDCMPVSVEGRPAVARAGRTPAYGRPVGQSVSPSPFFARTCTSYWVRGSRGSSSVSWELSVPSWSFLSVLVGIIGTVWPQLPVVFRAPSLELAVPYFVVGDVGRPSLCPAARSRSRRGSSPSLSSPSPSARTARTAARPRH